MLSKFLNRRKAPIDPPGYPGDVATKIEKRPRGRPSEGAREAILDATLELITADGIARLTTREIAARAGVSEASIYYHFTDKKVLLEGVIFDAVLRPLRTFAASFAEQVGDKPVGAALASYGEELERFWKRVLPVLSAVQADVELREHFRRRIAELGFGPHRGVRVLADYLREQQQARNVRLDADVEAAALSCAGASFLSAYETHMLGPSAREKLPTVEQAVEALTRLLAPSYGTKR
jgi:AcrR family transcriptional regulator